MPKVKARANRIILEPEEQIAASIRVLENGKCVSLSEAATTFIIPKSTLGCHK